MKFDKLTRNDADDDVTPRTREDWDEWVSATKLRGYLIGNTLGDWLDRYGEDNCFAPDPPLDERLDFGRFRFERGLAFEEAVAGWVAERVELVKIAASWSDSQDLSSATRTAYEVTRGVPAIHGAVLWNPEAKTYGIADFLVRSDIFDSLFPGHLPPVDVRRSAPLLNASWHYIVVDAKFTTLRFDATGRTLQNSGNTPAYKAQLMVYWDALARLQGDTPPRAFLLGRGYAYSRTADKKKIPYRGASAVAKLGPVSLLEEIPRKGPLRAEVEAAIHWVRDLRQNGADWTMLPVPTRPELRPPTSTVVEPPWTNAIRTITRDLQDLIRLPGIGAKLRSPALVKGLERWSDVRVTPESIGVTGPVARRILESVLDVNRNEGPPVRPAHVSAAESEWRKESDVEFFVDFETVSDLNDDFSQFPRRGGQPMIFMVGCGHIEKGLWQFRCFIADRLDEASEARALDAWFRHMKDTSARLGGEMPVGPRVFHWSGAEESTLETAYNAAVARHPERGWPHPNWFDLLGRVAKKEPVAVKGAFGFGLKEVAKTLHAHGLIETSWEDSQVDGLGAMVGAWRCDEEARRKGIRLADTELMAEIEEYNEVDCRVMWEILDYLRQHH